MPAEIKSALYRLYKDLQTTGNCGLEKLLPSVRKKKRKMADKLLSKLSQDFLKILNDEEYYDITIEVGNDPNVKVFRAHMNILNYRSPYLRRILSTNKKKNDGTLLNIKLSNVLPEIFDVILK